MATTNDFLSLMTSLLTSNNSIQGLYSGYYDPYSASSLYGNYGNNSSFSNIFNMALSSMQASNTSLLSDLASKLEDGSANTISEISDEDTVNFVNKLTEAAKDDCECNSAQLTKDLYQAYIENTTGYGKNILSQLITTINGNHSNSISTSTSKQSSTNTASSPAQKTNIEENMITSSIPTEAEIESMITATISLPS